MTETGSNDWVFDHIGYVTVPMRMTKDGSGGDESAVEVTEVSHEEAEEALLECALDGGATDVDFISNGDNEEYEGDGIDNDHNSSIPFADIRCEPTDLHKVVTALNENGYAPDEFGTRYAVKDEETGLVALCDESVETLEKLLGKLDEEDDVAQVYHNGAYNEVQ